MAYIPPHKRHSATVGKPETVSATSLSSRFRQTLSLSSSSAHRTRDKSADAKQGFGKIIYADQSISRWWLVGGDAQSEDLRLEPFPCEVLERKTGGKPLVLAIEREPSGGVSEEPPWVVMADRVVPDLLAAVESAMSEECSENEEIKLTFVARVGKVLFHGNSSSNCLNSIRQAAVAEEGDISIRRTFYTNVTEELLKNIEHVVVPKLGFGFEKEKELYQIQVFDKSRPGTTVICKCTVVGGGSLKLDKIELNQVRYLVTDTSCLCKDHDFRIMLATKRKLKILDDVEKNGINKLISSAVIDPNVKGGLRWPLGKESVADRFNVGGVWHTNRKAFRGPTMLIKLRHADRFDYRVSAGEVTDEVTLKLSKISQQLRDGNKEASSLSYMVQDAVKLIWDHLL